MHKMELYLGHVNNLFPVPVPVPVQCEMFCIIPVPETANVNTPSMILKMKRKGIDPFAFVFPLTQCETNVDVYG